MKYTKYLFAILLFLPLTLWAQKVITGTVVDTNNIPVPGASILVKGTTTGTITDFDGNYSINVTSETDVLVFSFLGLQSKEITVGTKTTINVTLEESQQQLEEIVLIGYGSVDRKDLTGSITSIKPNEEDAERSRSIEDIIRGQAAGVQVSNNSNEPGGSISVK